MKEILYKTITADTQVSTQDCYLVGAELSHTATTYMTIYNEDDSSKTSGKQALIVKVFGTGWHYDSKMFPKSGIKCHGLYVDWNAGVGTVYYHY